MVFLRPMTIHKNGVNWGNGFAKTETLKLILKMSYVLSLKCLIFQTNEESFTFDIFKIAVSINWKLEH